MTLEVNGARGEVALTIGDVELVIAATMEGLSAVSTALDCKSLADLFVRLSAVEISATRAAISYLTVKGDHTAANKALKLKHFKEVAAAFDKALSHHFDIEPGNEVAAAEPTKAA